VKPWPYVDPFPLWAIVSYSLAVLLGGRGAWRGVNDGLYYKNLEKENAKNKELRLQKGADGQL